MEIRNWKTDEIIYQADVDTIKELVEKAVKDGVSLEYADLRDADLRHSDLRGANLEIADLSDADLRHSDLRSTDLYYVDFHYADLRNARLSGANLECASLRGANLRRSDLSGANLRRSDFRDANLRHSDIREANFFYADLRGAHLRNADLRDSILYGADLRNAKNIPGNLPMACPKEGSFIAWKNVNGKLVKLEIPADAKRSSATSNKCRCSKAKVLAITDLDGTNPITEAVNYNYCQNTIYRVGEMVYPDRFDDNRWRECSNGIHFFMDKHDAINY